MINFWLNKVDKALRVLGYDISLINYFSAKEKEMIIINEYLCLLKERIDDIGPLSLEEMAEYILIARQNPVV